VVADVGVDTPLDFKDCGVVCDSSCVAVLAGGVCGTADLECVWCSHNYSYQCLVVESKISL